MNGVVGEPITVLYVGEGNVDESVAERLEAECDSLDVLTAAGSEQGLARLDSTAVDCVVSGYDIPGRDGLGFLAAVRERDPDLPFVLFTDAGNEAVASEAISAGVTDYLRKGTDGDQYALLANRIVRGVEAGRTSEGFTEGERRVTTLISDLPGMVYRCRNERGWPMECVSGGCAELTGYDPAALESDDVSWGADVLHPEDREETWTAVQRALEERESFEVTYRIETRDGDLRWVRERGRGIYDDSAGEAERTVVALEGFISDVTDLRTAEQRRRRYETVVESMEDGAYILDTDRRFEFANRALVDAVGMEREELVGRPVTAFESRIAAETNRRFEDLLATLEAGHKDSAAMEFEMELAEGTRTFRLHLTRLEDDGEYDGVLATVRDVTPRKRREQRLQQFASVVSHDLRNPLTVIEGRVEAARDSGDLSHLAAVDRSLDRMNDLIDDLLTLAKQGEHIGAAEPVEIGPVASAAWSSVDADDADLVVDEPGTVMADPDRLRQLFENLLRNAVEHGSEADRRRTDVVGQSPTTVTVRVGALPEATGFFVEDDGPGISEDDRDRVFEYGYTQSRDGTGLGLAIVRNVVTAHDWELTLTDSDAYGGARFEVRVD